MSPYYQLLRQAAGAWHDAGEARSIALLVLDEAFGVAAVDVYADKVRHFSEEECLRLENIAAALQRGEPVQYALGSARFCDHCFTVTPATLIPRPETEELVTRVLKFLSTHAPSPKPLVVDVGTGTGAIILSLAKEHGGDAVFLGTDISEDAIALAKENAARCGLSDRVRFAVSDGLDDFDEPQSVDVIVSNPPYVTTAVYETLDPRVKDFEPRLALDGGVEGLDFYDRYLADALNLLKPHGAVFFEIGEDQGEALRKLMTDYGFSEIRIEKDYGGHDRYASAVLP